MNKFIQCDRCRCLIDKQCRRDTPTFDNKGYAVWPQIKYQNGGCFKGISKSINLSDLVLNEQQSDIVFYSCFTEDCDNYALMMVNISDGDPVFISFDEMLHGMKSALNDTSVEEHF